MNFITRSCCLQQVTYVSVAHYSLCVSHVIFPTTNTWTIGKALAQHAENKAPEIDLFVWFSHTICLLPRARYTVSFITNNDLLPQSTINTLLHPIPSVRLNSRWRELLCRGCRVRADESENILQFLHQNSGQIQEMCVPCSLAVNRHVIHAKNYKRQGT